MCTTIYTTSLSYSIIFATWLYFYYEHDYFPFWTKQRVSAILLHIYSLSAWQKNYFFIFIFILLCALYLFLQELLYIHVQRQCNLRAELTSYYFILKKQNMSKQHSEQNILVLNHHSNNLFLLSLFSISNRTLFLNSLADSLPSCGNPAIKLIWRAGISKR